MYSSSSRYFLTSTRQIPHLTRKPSTHRSSPVSSHFPSIPLISFQRAKDEIISEIHKASSHTSKIFNFNQQLKDLESKFSDMFNKVMKSHEEIMREIKKPEETEKIPIQSIPLSQMIENTVYPNSTNQNAEPMSLVNLPLFSGFSLQWDPTKAFTSDSNPTTNNLNSLSQNQFQAIRDHTQSLNPSAGIVVWDTSSHENTSKKREIKQISKRHEELDSTRESDCYTKEFKKESSKSDVNNYDNSSDDLLKAAPHQDLKDIKKGIQQQLQNIKEQSEEKSKEPSAKPAAKKSNKSKPKGNQPGSKEALNPRSPARRGPEVP